MDPQAENVRSLYERYARQIYAYCLHQLRNREEAEDAAQSTFLNAFRGLQRGVQPRFEAAWLYKIAENVCLSRRRSATRRLRVEAPGETADVGREQQTEDLIALPGALRALQPAQQRALLLREWKGLSYREIADDLGLSQAAVETLLFRARRALASGLSAEGAATLGAPRRRSSAGRALHS